MNHNPLHVTSSVSRAAPSRSRFVDSTPLLSDPDILQNRAERDGYLFFRGLLAPEEVLKLRADMLAVVDRHGWRKPGQDALGGLVDVRAINQVTEEEMRLDIGVSAAAYNDIQKLERLHRLPHHPRLLALYRDLFGGREVLVHPRHIARMTTPHRSMVPTPPHQDFPLIQGTFGTWTCWFPVGACPRELGGLTVLHGSHKAGYVPVQPANGAGLIATQLCDYETDWVEGDFECGDVLTFPSYTVHKALKCQVKDALRLSLDVRYQPADEVVEEKSLYPHCGLSWDEVYEGWEQNDLKRYWERFDLTLVPWEDRYMQPGRRIC